MAIQDLLRFVGSLAGKSTPKTTGVDAEGMPVYKTGFWDTLYGSPGAQLNLEAQQNQGQFKRGVGRTPIIGELKRKEQALDTQSEAVTRAGLITLLKNSSDPNVRQVGEIMELTNTNEALQMRMLQEAYKNPATAKAILAKLTEDLRKAEADKEKLRQSKELFPSTLRGAEAGATGAQHQASILGTSAKWAPQSAWQDYKSREIANTRGSLLNQALPWQLGQQAQQAAQQQALTDLQMEEIQNKIDNPWMSGGSFLFNPITGEYLSPETSWMNVPTGIDGISKPGQVRKIATGNVNRNGQRVPNVQLPPGFAANVLNAPAAPQEVIPEIQMPTRRGPVNAQAKKRRLQLQVGPVDVTGIYDQVAPIYRVMKKGARSLLPF